MICLCVLLGLFTLVVVTLVVTPVIATISHEKSSRYENENKDESDENISEVEVTVKWIPVEVAKGTLTFEYGICIHHCPSEYGGGFVDREYPYTIKGNHLFLENKYLGIHSTSKIDCEFLIEEGGFLVIKNVTGFAGKYKKQK